MIDTFAPSFARSPMKPIFQTCQPRPEVLALTLSARLYLYPSTTCVVAVTALLETDQ